jgi:hypothetical protein
MADEAFALSPISARAAQPSEADYDAIREAFMETSRGRWFLGEYAKRNRNADTRLVLEAVARIEETLASQKKPARDPLLDEALASFRSALGEAKDATQTALGDLGLEENLAPIRKGARVIREIAWRLREIGADSRICDLIDSQVTTIEGAAAKVAPTDLASALREAFDLIEKRIAAFEVDEAEMPVPPSTEAIRSEALNETLEAAPPAHAAAAAQDATPATPPSSRLAAARQAASGARQAETAATERITAVEDITHPAASTEPADGFDAEDEAVLDLVALEMAAPDTDAAYEPSIDDLLAGEMSGHQAPPPEASVAPTPPAQTSVAAKQADVPIEDIEITFVSAVSKTPAERVLAAPAAPASPIQVASEVEPAASLGSSLLANGIVQRPKTAKPDPLAPIRRMSQSEKIAFFS